MINTFHILPRDGQRMGWDDQTTGLQSINQFTYQLEMDKEDGMWDDQSDNRSAINQQVYILAGNDKEDRMR